MRNYIIIEDDDLTFRVQVDDNKITSKRTNSEIWSKSAKGEVVAKLIDTGNNVKIKLGDKKIKLGYSELCNLFDIILLKLETDRSIRGNILILEDGSII